MKKHYIIYGLKDPNTNEIRYIGKSSVGLKRAVEHFKPFNLKPINHKTNWIKEVLRTGKKPIPIIIKESTLKEYGKDEITTIATYIQKGINLTNSTDGGEGAPGRVISDETRLKMSNKRRDYFKKLKESGVDVSLICAKTKIPHKFINNIEHKHCCNCKQFKNINQYAKSKNHYDGVQGECRECNTLRKRHFRAKSKLKKLLDVSLKANDLESAEKLLKQLQELG